MVGLLPRAASLGLCVSTVLAVRVDDDVDDSVQVSSATFTAPQSAKAAESDKTEWLRATNYYRCLHGVSAVSWSEDLALSAASWVAKFPPMAHANSYQLTPPQGENLAMSFPSKDITGRVKAWYDEVQDCATLPGCEKSNTTGATGHFTALVWKGVREMGCAAAQASSDKAWYYVCRYSSGPTLSLATPNMAGGYLDNVPAVSASAAMCSNEIDASSGMPGVPVQAPGAPTLKLVTSGKPKDAISPKPAIHDESDKGLPMEEINDWLSAHNMFRCMHGVPPVTWNSQLATGAQEWSESMPPMKHSSSYTLTPPSAENIAMNMPSKSIQGSVAAWYREVHNCKEFPGCKEAIGIGKFTTAFTAMVWKSVSEIGCGYNRGTDGAWYYVCRYYAGPSLSLDTPNIGGGFEKNVLAPIRAETDCKVPTGLSAPNYAAPPAPGPSSVEGNVDRQLFLATVNKYRCLHGVPPLSWNDAIAAGAMEWAAKMPPMDQSNSFALSPPQAENLAMTTTAKNIPDVVTNWYDEIQNCKSLPGCTSINKPGESAGFFTSMVWKGATEMGCAVHQAAGWYYVCRFAGGPTLGPETPNMLGAFLDNVPAASMSKPECGF